MAWLELHQTVKKHRKTLRLSSLLNISRREAVGLLCDLWLWAIDNADKNGVLEGLTAEDIGMALDMNKRQGERAVSALIESGYLDMFDGQYVLHDWYGYCGKLNEKRESDRKRKAETNWKSNGNPTEIQRTDIGNPLVTVPNLTIPNHTVGIPPLPPKGERDALFSTFWSAYPKKVAKPTAQAAFKKLNPDASLMEIILEALEKQKRSSQWTKDNGQYIPNPSTWLNQKRWEDKIPENNGESRLVKGKHVGFQNYDQGLDDDQGFYAGPDLLAEARKLREQNA